MAYPAHARLVLGGSLVESFSAQEIWTCSIAVGIGDAAGGWLKDPDAYLETIKGRVQAWYQLSSTGMSSGSRLLYMKCNNINPDGTYKDAVTHRVDYTPGVAGAGSPKGPAFLSLCTTWETGLTRGKAHRGRVYLPNATKNYAGSEVSTQDAALVAQAGKDLLTAITQPENGTTGFLVQPRVVSQSGPQHLITGVSADTVADYVSRRKDKIRGPRSTVAFP